MWNGVILDSNISRDPVFVWCRNDRRDKRPIPPPKHRLRHQIRMEKYWLNSQCFHYFFSLNLFPSCLPCVQWCRLYGAVGRVYLKRAGERVHLHWFWFRRTQFLVNFHFTVRVCDTHGRLQWPQSEGDEDAELLGHIRCFHVISITPVSQLWLSHRRFPFLASWCDHFFQRRFFCVTSGGYDLRIDSEQDVARSIRDVGEYKRESPRCGNGAIGGWGLLVYFHLKSLILFFGGSRILGQSRQWQTLRKALNKISFKMRSFCNRTLEVLLFRDTVTYLTNIQNINKQRDI